MPRLLALIAVFLSALAAFAALAGADREKRWDIGPSEDNPYLSAPQQATLAKIPPSAAIAAHLDGYIYVLDADGGNATRISLEKPRGTWEHVAAGYDRRYIAANEQLPNPRGLPGGVGRLWLFDTELGTRTRLVPAFDMAGNGGVDWDRNGFIYFAAKEKDIIEDAKTPEDFRANAGENDIYRMKYDGAALQRLTRTKDHGEADVSVSEDGTMIAYASLNIPEEVMEIWIAQSDGRNPRMVFRGGTPRTAGAHDPEFSPDNEYLVFSRVNADAPPNFPDNPDANTAHDVYRFSIDDGTLMRLTKPGHISIAPDWTGDRVLFLDISERERYAGISTVAPDRPDQPPRLLHNGMNIGKWIPGAFAKPPE